jgi:hypothetical protein
MDLRRSIEIAHDLTRRLHEALENQDLDVWHQILEQRGQALVAFEKIHREASKKECFVCRSALESLNRADEHLQERSKVMLAIVGEEFRGQLGSPAKGPKISGGDLVQACLDRKV